MVEPLGKLFLLAVLTYGVFGLGVGVGRLIRCSRLRPETIGEWLEWFFFTTALWPWVY